MTAQVGAQTNGLPKLSLKTIWLMNFGFLGVQTAFTLQSSQMSRIFQTIGADPGHLGWFFILPPLAGLITQPIVGHYSDRTWWPKLGGRRLPYLIMGTAVAVIVMLLLPNAGSFNFATVTAALVFGAVVIAFLDVSSNVAMQPFKMMVGDMVNEEQKGYAYGIQSFFSNFGSVIAAIFPFVLTAFGVANIAAAGEVPDSVKISFYVGAALLLITTVLTVAKVKEYDPPTYARYHNLAVEESGKKEKGEPWYKLLASAPKTFWTVTVVQFFSWFAFQYMWTYSAGAIARNVWDTTDATSAGYQDAGNWYGVLAAVQSVAAVIWSYVLAKVDPAYHKICYSLSLALGGLGLASVAFVSNQYVLIGSYVLVGIAWAAILTYPLTFVTNALNAENKSKDMGSYLGLFNGSICLPQIVASVASFAIYPLIGSSQSGMFYIAGVALLLGALAVHYIKPEHEKVNA
ncbi:MAG: SLC45 family MFS transporter [Corynebacterium sp.]|nr:SLC45 family MFS transporter [Corynebacterium sp.]